MNTKVRICFVLLLLVILVVAVWFFRGDVLSGRKIRNVLLISIDTCRADYLGCYGYRRKTTPNIDEVAKESVLFENVVVPAPLTLPSHSSMLTGTTPLYHGIHDNLDYQLGQSNITLAEILKGHGFATGAIISAFVLDSQFGLDQGFDTYNDQFEEEHYALDISERRGGEASRFALEWLEEHKNEKFFFFLHYFDPHALYEPPEPFASRFAHNLYAGEIAYTDYCIGQVIEKLKELGIYDSTLIIITGDHGEMLGEHGEQTHCYFIYQSAIKVPLIFKLPGQRKAKRIKEMVGLVDIVPTICSLLEIKPPPEVRGVDLSACFGRKKLANRQRHIYCESLYPTKYNANSLLSVVTERWKYIQTTRPELYDLAKDPQELNNLVAKEPQRAHLLKEHLKLILQEQIRKDSDSKFKLDEQGRRRLESLGYVASSSVKEDFEFDQSKDDPKDLIDFHCSDGKVTYLISRGKYAEAKELCEEMLVERPDSFGIRLNMAKIAFKQDDFARAIPHLYQALKLRPDRYEVHNNLGTAFTELGKFEEAVKCFEEALRLGPGKPIVLNNLGFALLQQGKHDEAITHYEYSLKLEPDQPVALNNIGEVYFMQGKIEKAFSYWNKVLKLQPDRISVLNNLAWIKATEEGEQFRNPDEAVQLAQRACELTDYKEAGLLDTLSVAYAAAGKFDEAVETAEKAIELALSSGQNELAEEIQKHLELFKAGKPYRKLP